jgi:hypothetical protein
MHFTFIAEIVRNLVSLLNCIAGREHPAERIINTIIGKTLAHEVT